MARHLLLKRPLHPWTGSEKAYLFGIWITPEWTPEQYEFHNVELISYHWDDRRKLDRDIDYIKNVIEDFLERLSIELNRLHEVNYSKIYWRILLGEWLYLAVQITFDRLETLRIAEEAYGAIPQMEDSELFWSPPANIVDFLSSIRNPEWNSQFIEYLNAHLKYASKVEGYYRFNIDHETEYEQRKGKFSKTECAKRVSKFLFTQFNRIKPRIQLSNTYLNLLDEYKLAIGLRTLPFYISKTYLNPSLKIIDRSQIKLHHPNDDEFKLLMSSLLTKILPVSYFEAYEDYSQKINIQLGQNIPRSIVTANDFSGNESWKFRTAKSVECGSNLLILQHGGLYGVNSKSLMQDYEVSIADTYLTWGWRDLKNPKVLSAPATKLIRDGKAFLKRSKNESGKVLLVTFEMPLMSYWLASMPIGPQVKDASEVSYRIISEIKEEFRKDLRIRIFPQNFGLNQREKFVSLVGDKALSEVNESFQQALGSSKLVISTYNSTTFIESMKKNIPTVICWQPEFWEVTPEAQGYFDRLVACKVMFYSPFECSNFLNTHWNDIYTWWFSKEVQSAVEDFLKTFGYTGSHPIKELRTIIQSHSKK